MIQMDQKKKMYGIMLIILFGFSLSSATNVTKAMVEVDYYVAFLRPQYPEVNALMIELHENYVLAAAEYRIQVNLHYISQEEANIRFFYGLYDIIDFPRVMTVYGDLEALNTIEAVISALDFYLSSGYFRYDFKKVDKLTKNLIKIHSLYDKYLLAELEEQEVLFESILDKIHMIEKLLYSSQIFEVNNHFVVDYYIYKVFYTDCFWFNSEQGKILNNEDVRLTLSYLFDREQIAYIYTQIPYPFPVVYFTQTCHLLGWSQYHDTSLPEIPPLP